MSSPKSLYRYQPLGVNEIRLLTYSVESPQPVWHFKHQNLDDEPEFYAVSYTWGQNASIPRAFVDVEDGIIEVGDNLNNLLHSLDSFDRSISIWIDAICINQSNDSEKMHQVPLMGRIYSDASKVLIYLGEPYSGNPDTGAQLPKIIKAMSKMETGGDQSHLQFGRPLATDLILNQMNMCDILTKEWWTRLWTMQEYVLARNPVFIYGNSVINDSDLGNTSISTKN